MEKITKTFVNNITLQNIFWEPGRGVVGNLFLLQDKSITYILSFTYNHNLNQSIHKGLEAVATCPCCIEPGQRKTMNDLIVNHKKTGFISGAVRWMSGDLHKLKTLPEFEETQDVFTDNEPLHIRISDDAWELIAQEVVPLFTK